MKKSDSHLQAALVKSLQADLTGLSEKHAKKLQKTVASAAKKIARKFAKLLAKQRKADKTTVAKAVPPVLRKAATRRVVKQTPKPATRPKARAAASS